MNNTAASSRRRPGALPTSATSTDDTNKLQAQYKQDKEKFADFIRNFKTEENGEETFKYVEILKKIATREQKILNIELDDLTTHFKNEILTEAIIKNTVRYVNLFCDVIDEELPTTDMPVNEEDVLDVLRMHRLTSMTHNGAKNKPGPARPADASTNKQESEETLPKELLRRYELNFIAPHKMPEVPLREVRARHIGQLVSVRGVVTRCSEVKPLLQIATYTCEDCGFEIYQRITQRVYIPLHQCPNCAKTTGRGQLTQQTRGCKFVKFQDMRIQENAAQVPIGHVPRTLHVHIQGELTRHCAPGDNITVHGVFLPLANEGFQAIKTGLVAETYLYAMHVVQHKKKYSEFNPTEDMASKIEKFIEEPDAYTRLARSIAPEIWGMLDVKKALLLQMVGGVTKVMRDGMKIRGDINICLMGDPGVAKSQLLKHIATLAPRAVYTSGKGSSGVGLTAAILKDPITGEMTLEGGSLVLSDMGICCIDEFDKMDDYDRTAIHEVMEQQTISIAKAGITTSLNARTAILAAANPAYGRYNPARPPLENINLPAALLSRFDLLFLLLDKADPMRDRELAEHVTHVHRFSRHPTMDTEACSPEFIRAFIALAKRQQPSIPRELRTHLVDSYVNMRHDDLTQHRRGGQFTYTTARTLLATLRIAQALARLRFATHVTSADVEEALRLLDASKASLWESQHGSGAAGGARRAASDFATAVFGIVRDWALSHDEIELNYEDLLPVVLARGYSQEQFDKTLEIYERLEIWIVSANRRTITFVSHGQ